HPGARAMGKKTGKDAQSLEEVFRAMVELAGWQAELARSGLRLLKETQAGTRKRPDSGRSSRRR
ncbi:hypothetical protein LCGC14_2564610, partial [marine sediment metagenome]